MWILPKQLHTSAFVLDTAALISDLAEQSQICEPSLLARSKPSLARTWLQKWKRDSWMQHLSGRILKPSHGQSFVIAWTSSLEVIPASHSQQQANDSDETILDTSGLGSQMEFVLCDHESASLKTSKDTSASDSERSLVNWKALVIKRRGEYSQRVKSAHLTNESECSSWPTAKARDWKDTMGCSLDAVNPDGTHRNRRDRLVGAIAAEIHGQAVPVSHSTDGSRQESSQEGRLWMTPKSGQCGMTATTSGRPLEKATQLTTQVYVVNRQESWLTPRANEPGLDRNFVNRMGDRGKYCHVSLTSQIESWATPSTMDHINVVRNPEERSPAANKGGCKNLREEVHQWATPNTMDHLDCRSAEGVIKIATGARKGRSMPSNLREQVDPQTVDIYQKTKEESWATPRAGATDNSRPNNKGGIPLGDQARRAEQWATPQSRDAKGAEGRMIRDGQYSDLPSQIEVAPTGQWNRNNGKLNPRWVETLMGLPIGWTMPSCSSPLTIAPTNCDYSETESFPQLLPGLF